MVWIVTTQKERNSLIPKKKFNQLQGLYGDDIRLVFADEPFILYDILRKDDVVLVETKKYEIITILNDIGCRHTGESIQTIKFDEDKILLKYLLHLKGIPTPKHIRDLSDIEDGKKYFVKPLELEDSVGISDSSLCSSREEVSEYVKFIRDRYEKPSIIEPYIEGKDVTISVIRTEQGLLVDGVVIHTNADSDFLTYAVKNNNTETYEPYKGRALDVAKDVFSLIGARNYARMDFRVTKNDTPYLLEVNLYAGLGNTGYMYRCLEYNRQWSHRQMVDAVISTASNI